jgi:hypothetical protein
MQEMSTSVDINTAGGAAYVYKGFKPVNELAVKPDGIMIN